MKKYYSLLVVVLLFVGCKTQQTSVANQSVSENKSLNYLALGDSYTIGESVCESCSFPIQLMAKIAEDYNAKVNLEVIAKTGWTTSNLIQAIKDEKPTANFDLVTLLIGVNNQYQGKDFSLYEEDFPALLQKAIQLASGDIKKVIVVSIPDYAYTPFGQQKGNTEMISSEIDAYNVFAKRTAERAGVSFVNITDISRLGLKNETLVASDGLHPSKEAYSSFVTQILFEIRQKNYIK
ncbi:SGNH/GDSL hydrolase family protein [Joostella sp. CR20]|uniref:SGNH/GDSL hydrolase family protein n=1 Tax=Joostella sp. CR20 TaxID=2804312 RepID=UPI00313A98D5